MPSLKMSICIYLYLYVYTYKYRYICIIYIYISYIKNEALILNKLYCCFSKSSKTQSSKVWKKLKYNSFRNKCSIFLYKTSKCHCQTISSLTFVYHLHTILVPKSPIEKLTVPPAPFLLAAER